jgi:hypothetical protein
MSETEQKKEKSEHLKKLEHARDTYVTRIFWMMIEIAIIFGIPAFIGVGIMKYFDLSSGYIPVVFLPALIISWIGVVYRYRQIKNKLEDLDSQIQQAREKEGILPQKNISEEEYREMNE